jgi:hypothetical protein
VSEEDHTRVPCLVCGGALPNLDAPGNQPSGGLEFTTHGHYGSSEFDPMDGTLLAINVCDKCLAAARRAQRVLLVHGHRARPTFDYSVWSREEDEPKPN